jgi:hypothetical protein
MKLQSSQPWSCPINKPFYATHTPVVRRCQMLSASARGERVPQIAHQVGYDDQVVRNVIHGFNATGLDVLRRGSSRPHRLRTSFTEEGLGHLQDLLHRSPLGERYHHAVS